MFSLLSRGASDRAVGSPKVETRASEKTRSLKPTPRSDFREPGAFGPKDLVNGFREQTAPPAIGPSAVPKVEALDDGQAGLLHLSGLSWPYPLYVLLYKADDVPGPRQNLYSISPQVAGTRQQAPSPWPAATELPARLSTSECARSAVGPNLKSPHSPQPH